MKKKEKKIIILCMVVIAFTIHLQSIICLNDIECIFTEGEAKVQLKQNVVKGSSHFLESYSYANRLLKLYEDSDINTFDKQSALDLIEKVTIEIEAARAYYNEALRLGEDLGYIDQKTNLFRAFDYNSFISGSGMIPEIANSVKSYMEKGDILGIYRHNLSYIESIQLTLKTIKDDVSLSTQILRPNVTNYWILLQKYAEAALFGNYSTIIGSTVLEQCQV